MKPPQQASWRFPEDLLAYFQPEYSINQQKIVGIEALARMRDASGQILSPDSFIPFLDMDERRELSRLMLVAVSLAADAPAWAQAAAQEARKAAPVRGIRFSSPPRISISLVPEA